MIHIDDVYESAYQHAVPALRRQNFKAEFFAHTHYVGKTGRSPKMSWDKLRQLERDRLFAVYSHTWKHPDLRKVSRSRSYPECKLRQSELESELKLPLRDLIEHLSPKRAPQILAYPMGFFSKNVLDATKQDYLIAYATNTEGVDADRDRDWLYKIPREKMEPHYDLKKKLPNTSDAQEISTQNQMN
jgi:peptidoglycan/xylan/chitin deacetylase (PgdA/CDA1 family)